MSKCPFCGNRRTQYRYTTIAAMYRCKCGAKTILKFKKNSITYTREWVRLDD